MPFVISPPKDLTWAADARAYLGVFEASNNRLGTEFTVIDRYQVGIDLISVESAVESYMGSE